MSVRRAAAIVLAGLLSMSPVLAQSKSSLATESITVDEKAWPGSLAGAWTYRSYLNKGVLVGDDPNKALALIFGEGTMSFGPDADGSFAGTLDMGSGYVLDLKGTERVTPAGELWITLAGIGRAGTPTDNWEYDYNAVLTPKWPNGVNQVPAIVGTVIRAKPHDGAPAGFVASFIAVRN